MSPKLRHKSQSSLETPDPSEREILRAILAFLTLRGVFHWRQNSAAFALYGNGKRRFVRAGFPGVSDIIGILPQWWYEGKTGSGLVAAVMNPRAQRPDVGQFLAIEVKRPGQKPTADQQAFLEAVRANGGIAFVATSVEDVKRELDVIYGRKNNSQDL